MTEIWTPVVGYEGMYEVSNAGSIRSMERMKIQRNRWGMTSARVNAKLLKTTKTRTGYIDVQLCKDGVVKHHLIHRLVAHAFISQSDMQVNHKDGNKQNNHLSNIEYCTASENQIHRSQVLGKCIGDSSASSKLTEKQVHLIRADKRTLKAIAADYAVSFTTIHAVKSRKTWGHV